MNTIHTLNAKLLSSLVHMPPQEAKYLEEVFEKAARLDEAVKCIENRWEFRANAGRSVNDIYKILNGYVSHHSSGTAQEIIDAFRVLYGDCAESDITLYLKAASSQDPKLAV